MTTRLKCPEARYKYCEVVRKNFNNMFPLSPPTSTISISWQFASYVIFIHELGKHPHNVLEDGKKEEELLKEKSESIPRGLILSFKSILIPADSLSRAGENGKYCASYYLFTYLHFLPFSTPPFNSISSRRHPNCPLGTSWVAKIS